MHPWDVSPKEAIEIQKSLMDHLNLEDDFGEIKTVAGVDVGFEEDNTVTLRERDSMEQTRINLDQVKPFLLDKLNM